MIKLIISVLLLVATIATLVITLKKENEFGCVTLKWNKKGLLSVVPLGLLVFVQSICVIPSNTVGVKYSALHGTSKNTLKEGVHFVTPFVDKIYKIDTTVQERTDDKVSVQTKDAQWAKMQVNVKYEVSKSNAFKVYKQYKTMEALKDNIIGNYAQNAMNEVCSNYNIIDLLGEKRNEIINKATDILKQNLEKEGVTLKMLTIKDLDAGKKIEKAISDEAVAKKQVETAKQKQDKARTEAETKLIEAEGEANANAVKTKALTPEVLQEQWINKWDGKLPKVTDGNTMIGLDNLK
ncbi:MULTISPECIES: prohibitin family protein [unclassified Holdemanella]|uniref:prohibitin family protein n=1 Tax=unclassified Holdemanella TaxID=2633909 RepID=UPI001D0BC0AB|nr:MULTISPECIES: prohibitin family protein [unclassified Holdemanella]MCB8640065.1 prohibitin family protein [Holdemanella sp. DFI.5.55]MCG5648793.1 prohibitin family protein [Holdemanella sp. DFI.5.21]